MQICVPAKKCKKHLNEFGFLQSFVNIEMVPKQTAVIIYKEKDVPTTHIERLSNTRGF
jgi:hypothetical protein